MKKRIIAVTLSIVLALSAGAAGVFVGYRMKSEKPNDKNVSVPTAQAKAKDAEKVSLDSAIDIAFKDAGIKREDAVMTDLPTLDKDDIKPHYDIEFKHEDVKYEYEIAVDNGSVIKAEKEKDRGHTTEKATETTKVKEENKDVTKNKETTKAATTAKETDKAYISVEKAKEIALNNAGVKKADAVFKKAHHDYDDLVAHFDIKFVANGYEYEYEIKAADGKILEKDIERAPAYEQAVQTTVKKELITKDKAKDIAIGHAKVDASKVRFVRAELDRDDLISHYEVEFTAGIYEYEYEINAETGKIVAYDKGFIG